MLRLLASIIVALTILSTTVLFTPRGSSAGTAPPPGGLCRYTISFAIDTGTPTGPFGGADQVGPGFWWGGSPNRTQYRLTTVCQASSFDAAPGHTDQTGPGSFAVLSGVVIPGSVQCPNDYLVIFVSNTSQGPVQMLPACLTKLPAVSFPTTPLSLPATAGPVVVPIDVLLWDLPLVIVSPVYYFAALLQPGANVTAILDPATVITVASCTPATVGTQLVVNCQ